jgi:hypothetical protein
VANNAYVNNADANYASASDVHIISGIATLQERRYNVFQAREQSIDAIMEEYRTQINLGLNRQLALNIARIQILAATEACELEVDTLYRQEALLLIHLLGHDTGSVGQEMENNRDRGDETRRDGGVRESG